MNSIGSRMGPAFSIRRRRNFESLQIFCYGGPRVQLPHLANQLEIHLKILKVWPSLGPSEGLFARLSLNYDNGPPSSTFFSRILDRHIQKWQSELDLACRVKRLIQDFLDAAAKGRALPNFQVQP